MFNGFEERFTKELTNLVSSSSSMNSDVHVVAPLESKNYS
jgi:hypothetical protein